MQTDKPLYAEGEDPSVVETASQRSAKKSTTGKRSEQFAYLEDQI